MILRTTCRGVSLALLFVLAFRSSGATLRKGMLVFVANPAGNWELFVLRAGEAAAEQLTHTPLDERAPALSHDGRRVAYATSDGALWVMTVDTHESVRLELPKGTYGYPSWLSDDSGIVYTSYEYGASGEDADLFVYRFRDRRAEPFVLQTGPQDHSAIAPDGEHAAFVTSSATTIPGFGSQVTQEIWIASTLTGNAQQVTAGNSRNTRPAWSKDGGKLAFSSDRSGTPQIWVVHADGRELRHIRTDSAARTAPTWSPDGTHIACTVTKDGGSRLEVIDVRTGKGRELAPFGSRDVDVRDPSWR